MELFAFGIFLFAGICSFFELASPSTSFLLLCTALALSFSIIFNKLDK